MGYRIPWNRLPEAERQRRIKAGVAVESRRNTKFRAQLAEIEAANTDSLEMSSTRSRLRARCSAS